MKKCLCVLLSMMLLFSLVGCTSANDASGNVSGNTSAPQNSFTLEPTGTPTPVPTPTATPEPKGEPGYARSDGVGLIYAFLNRGDVVEVVAEDGDYYVVSLDGLEVLVEKRLVAMLIAGEYETWTGYARNKAPVYADFHMIGEIVQELKTNATVIVLADLGNCYLVILENESVGYIPSNSVSKSKISGDGGDGGGGGGGGSDGGDIVLGAFGGRFSAVRLGTSTDSSEEFIPGQATVLMDQTEAYIRFLSKDEAVKVIDANESYYVVLESGTVLSVVKFLLRLESEHKYEPWNGYARSQAPLYTTFWLEGDAIKLKKNKELVVLEDLGYCYLVEVDGSFGFVPIDQVSVDKQKSEGENGGNDGGNGGGGGEWTEPVL